MDIFCHHVRKCRLPNKIAAMVIMGSDTKNTTILKMFVMVVLHDDSSGP